MSAPENHRLQQARRCPVGVVCVEGRIVCYTVGEGSADTAVRELGGQALPMTAALARAIAADMAYQRGKEEGI